MISINFNGWKFIFRMDTIDGKSQKIIIFYWCFATSNCYFTWIELNCWLHWFWIYSMRPYVLRYTDNLAINIGRSLQFVNSSCRSLIWQRINRFLNFLRKYLMSQGILYILAYRQGVIQKLSGVLKQCFSFVRTPVFQK